MTATRSSPETFSHQLKTWLHGSQPKNLETLIEQFRDKSFAVVTLLLMLIPALPIPTGGITHVFEVVVMLLAIEQIIGLKAIWLPDFLAKRVNLQKFSKGKAANAMLKRVQGFEKRSSKRGRWIFSLPLLSRLLGVLILGFTLTAFLAPPFSGLDTFPSVAVVLISLAIILEDAIMLIVGNIIGVASVFATIFLGSVITHFIKGLL